MIEFGKFELGKGQEEQKPRRVWLQKTYRGIVVMINDTYIFEFKDDSNQIYRWPNSAISVGLKTEPYGGGGCFVTDENV